MIRYSKWQLFIGTDKYSAMADYMIMYGERCMGQGMITGVTEDNI